MTGKIPYRFALITTSEYLIENIKRIIAGKDIELQIVLSGLDEAVPYARELEAAGTELLITGSYTRLFLADQVNIPVVTFTYSAMTLIQCVYQAMEIGRKIMIPVMSDNLQQKDETAERLLNITMDRIQYRDCAGARKLMQYTKDNAYDVVVGANLIRDYAGRLDIPVIELRLSEAEMKGLIDNACWAAKSRRQEKEVMSRYQHIINSASDGIVAVDAECRITNINETATGLLGLTGETIVGQAAEQYFPTSNIAEAVFRSQAVTDQLDKVNRKSVVWNHRPFEVDGKTAGCVSTVNEISKVIRAENKIRKSLSKGHVARYTISSLLHKSDRMKEIVAEARQYAKTNSNLLISGETGTGKEILAQGVHNLSQRKNQAFVSLNCAALPDQLLESELFGHEEGAFTGSRKGGKPGLFELAHKGSIFLDEIGETPESVQIRLLRVLQEKEIMRLGGDSLVPVDVRVIAASHRDLRREVQAGTFREDLYFRLNILHIHIPPLRERLEDIPVLLNEFIQYFANKHRGSPIGIPPHLLKWLRKYEWPGNVRQLRNFTERLVLLSEDGFDKRVFDKLFSELTDSRYQNVVAVEAGPEKGVKEQFEQLKTEGEVNLIKRALEEAQYSRVKAARILGISRSTLWTRMKKAGLL